MQWQNLLVVDTECGLPPVLGQTCTLPGVPWPHQFNLVNIAPLYVTASWVDSGSLTASPPAATTWPLAQLTTIGGRATIAHPGRGGALMKPLIATDV